MTYQTDNETLVVGGLAAVYISSTIALAVLAPPVMIIEIQFSPALVLTPAELPQSWKQSPAPEANAADVDNRVNCGKWRFSNCRAAIVREELNSLLNPVQPHFGQRQTASADG